MIACGILNLPVIAYAGETMAQDVSIVIPVYNAEQTVATVVKEACDDLKDILHEIILVNDGSRDASAEVCEQLANQYQGRVKYVELTRNYAEHNAVMAGLHYISGEYVVIMDDDGQNPCSGVRKLYQEIEKGFDVVYSWYEKKEHSFTRNLGSFFNDKMANLMLRKPKDLYLSSFKILTKFTVQQITQYSNPYPYIDGLIFQVTDRIGQVQVEHRKRESGGSKYTYTKLAALWMNMFTNFSILPLRLAGVLGFFLSLVGMGLAVGTVIEKFINPELPIGYASIIVAVLVVGGTHCFLLGVIGEYLGRLFLSVNKKPQFTVRRRVGW